MSSNPLKDISELIETFRKQFGSGKSLVTAHFIPNEYVPKGTIYVMELKPLHLDPMQHLDSPNINLDKDYGIAIHPDTLLMVRAEFHRCFPATLLTDTEIAVILAEGVLDGRSKASDQSRRGIYGIGTSGS